MRVLVVSNMYPDDKHPSYGIFVAKFCEQLTDAGIDYELSVMHKAENLISKVLGYVAFYLGSVYKILTNQYDIIYIHYASHSSAPVLFANRIKKQQIFTNVHGSDVIPENERQLRFQKYTKNALKHSEIIVVPSLYFKEVVSNKYGVDRDIIKVYPSGGVDESIFHSYSSEETDKIKDRYGFDNNKKTFAYVGRISEGKGWDTFVEAINRNNNFDSVNYIIVGDGPQRDTLDKLLSNYNLQNKIIQIGLLPHRELAVFYAAIDFLVFPTKREGESLGLVALEAMACGTPVIASDYAAPHYYMKDFYNGRVFQMGNYIALSKVLKDCETVGTEDLRIGAKQTVEPYLKKNIGHVIAEIIREEKR